jgi:hypothetical protein
MQKSDAKMKKLFGHKYILRIVAFVVLAIAVVNISLPKIEEYNSAVHEQQNKLKIEANGDNSILGIGIYVFIEGNFNFVFTIILIALFLSLLLTKRIILSLIFAFLLLLQIIILQIIPINFSINSYLFEFIFMVCWFSLSFWLALASCRLLHSKFQTAIFLK